ncbi:MAG: hypothetical protein D4R73_03690 [Deltaproteobacteria bacterium]|nr:MAG: hypothetical protein D4R73_03690 [Deltaproteobacteria bacterium]
MGNGMRIVVLVCLVVTGVWGCASMIAGTMTSNFHMGFDGKAYKTQAEADQTFQQALSEIPERGKPVADRALLVLPSATALGLYQMKMQDQMSAQMQVMSPMFGSGEQKNLHAAGERVREIIKQYLEKYHAFYAEALQKRHAFKQVVVEKSDRPALVQRPEYDVNILLILKDSGQEEWVVRTSILNASQVPMAKPMPSGAKSLPAGGSAWLRQWLEDLESQTEGLLKRQKQAAAAK